MTSPGVIVVVEDDEDDIFLTTHVLTRAGLSHDILVARDGRAALDLLLPPAPYAPAPAILVLLDLNLPHIGGLEILRRLRADPRTATLPVIAFTSTRTDEDHLRTHSQPTGFTHKPLTVAAFQSVSTGLGLPAWT